MDNAKNTKINITINHNYTLIDSIYLISYKSHLLPCRTGKVGFLSIGWSSTCSLSRCATGEGGQGCGRKFNQSLDRIGQIDFCRSALKNCEIGQRWVLIYVACVFKPPRQAIKISLSFFDLMASLVLVENHALKTLRPYLVTHSLFSINFDDPVFRPTSVDDLKVLTVTTSDYSEWFAWGGQHWHFQEQGYSRQWCLHLVEWDNDQDGDFQGTDLWTDTSRFIWLQANWWSSWKWWMRGQGEPRFRLGICLAVATWHPFGWKMDVDGNDLTAIHWELSKDDLQKMTCAGLGTLASRSDGAVQNEAEEKKRQKMEHAELVELVHSTFDRIV